VAFLAGDEPLDILARVLLSCAGAFATLDVIAWHAHIAAFATYRTGLIVFNESAHVLFSGALAVFAGLYD
jgi:hypothetical protein